MGSQLYQWKFVLKFIFGLLHLCQSANGNYRIRTTNAQWCVFPFQYSGKLYDSCTGDGYSGTPWCGTTDNYDRDREWEECQVTDPYRWIASHGKPVVQSSTDGLHVASFATDGDYNIYLAPLNYTQTTISNKPYLQIDLGESIFVTSIQVNIPALSDYTDQTDVDVTVGDDAAVASTSNHNCQDVTLQKYTPLQCNKKGRYVTFQKSSDNAQLRFTEIAVSSRKPVENVAYKKTTEHTSAFSDSFSSKKAVDMTWWTAFSSNMDRNHWVRVDLETPYLVQEILIVARTACCTNKRLHNFDLRVGNSLTDNGNANPLCSKNAILFTGEIKSFYCNMFGRYVNLVKASLDLTTFSFGEVTVNPEKTVNIAPEATPSVDTAPIPGHNWQLALNDQDLARCHITQPEEKSKSVSLNLGGNYNIAMILIVNHPDYLDVNVDVKISVGTSEDHITSTPCVPGTQNIVGVLQAFFFCEPRITGSHVFVYQERTDRQISVCEIGVFEETKPKILDIKTDQFTWAKEGSDLTLTCNAKGYPAPVVTWVKDNVVIENTSSTLQLKNVKLNQSGIYECWADNKHGVDGKQFYLSFTSNLRMCVKTSVIQYTVGKSQNNHIELNGKDWFKFYDPKSKNELEFEESPPQQHISSCVVWLNGGHPKVQDGVVSRTLCLKNETHDCSERFDIFIRRCATYYVYNIRNLHNTAGMPLCLRNVQDKDGGFHPVIASPIRRHVLKENVFHTETEISQSYECLMMCQLQSRCKSFNYSKKLKTCELNSATKKEFPKKYSYNADYDYYHMGGGVVMVAKQDL